ncbi:Cobalt-precorrin-6y C5-methyltransferase [Clostridiaceae bacterium JG1575]|nr:Cobalt-precorrin-6y C5-methyltransferase [Clostridiaceae bacterium JG1575]
MKRLVLAGMGPGDPAYATQRVEEWKKLLPRRLTTREMPLKEILAALESYHEDTLVLLSGDSGFHSLAKLLVERFQGVYKITLEPGISSVSALAAKMGVRYDDAYLLSLHGKETAIVPVVAYHQKVFALTGGTQKAHEVCRSLQEAGLGALRVSVGEALCCPGERVVSGTAQELAKERFLDLSVLLVEHPEAVDPHRPLADSEFLRAQVPMTKQEVRWLSLQILGVLPSDVVWDVGAGTGSVSVELARRAFQRIVYAVEMKEDALALCRQNRIRHGAYNLTVVAGEAPGALQDLPSPDKVFIGGTKGGMSEILDTVWAKNPACVVVLNAVSLQSLEEGIGYCRRHGIHLEATLVQAARSRTLGAYDLMMGQNPVYILRLQKEATS